MLTLHVFAPAMGTISPSPFSVKSLLLMELGGLPYTRRAGDPRKAPKGKLPVLVDDGRTIPDSEAIRAHLAAAHGVDIDAHLDEGQRAQALAIRVMVDEYLYWALVHSRWIERPEDTRAAFFGALPAPLRKPVFAMVRRQVAKSLKGQGMGRHTPEEIVERAREGLAALATLLGEGPYLFGEAPSSADLSLFGYLENLLAADLDTPLKRAAQEQAPLVAYHARIRAGIAAPLVP